MDNPHSEFAGYGEEYANPPRHSPVIAWIVGSLVTALLIGALILLASVT